MDEWMERGNRVAGWGGPTGDEGDAGGDGVRAAGAAPPQLPMMSGCRSGT